MNISKSCLLTDNNVIKTQNNIFRTPRFLRPQRTNLNLKDNNTLINFITKRSKLCGLSAYALICKVKLLVLIKFSRVNKEEVVYLDRHTT